MKSRKILLLLGVSLMWSAVASAFDTPETKMLRIENAQSPNREGFDPLTLEEVMAELSVPGVSIAVIHDFGIHWAKGYGVADVESGSLVDADTSFQAASISKPVAAMAVVKAVQDGKFELDDDINGILTSWKLAAGGFTESGPVTPRSLLSHTSGLGDGFGFPGYEPSAPLPTTVQILNGDAPSNVGPVLMERPPLTGYQYSGGGVTIMQLALTDALGQPFPQILRATVLDPIGMVNSAYEQPLSPERDKNAARAHGSDGRSMGAKWHVYPELEAAGLWTTPTDLARFAIDVQQSIRDGSGRVLSRAMASEMVNPVGVGDYGVGLSVNKTGQGWYFGHGGSNWGFRCRLWAHKIKGYGLVVMTNGDRGSLIAEELRDRVARAYDWDSEDKPIPR